MSDDKIDRVLEHLDKLHAGIDSMGEKHDKLAARIDVLEAAHKRDSEEREMADKARKDAEEKERADSATRAKLQAIDESAAQFAAAQLRADAAYQAWGKQAPHALHGESLRDFQIRLLNPLKQHSKAYADSALNLIGDDAAFSVIEGAIISDAITASNTHAPAGTLREIKSRSDSGHVVTKFVGDPEVTWATFMGGHTRFGRINPKMVDKARQ